MILDPYGFGIRFSQEAFKHCGRHLRAGDFDVSGSSRFQGQSRSGRFILGDIENGVGTRPTGHVLHGFRDLLGPPHEPENGFGIAEHGLLFLLEGVMI